MRLCLLLDKHLADLVVLIHQRAQIVANLNEHIVRVSLGNLLDPLHLFVVLDFLRVGRVLDLPELRLQIIQYILNLACGALDVLVKLASLLDCSDCCVCCGQKGERVNRLLLVFIHRLGNRHDRRHGNRTLSTPRCT